MSATITADNGVMLPLDSLAQTFTYTGSFINTISVEYAGNTYVQTYDNDGTHITFISQWEGQNLPPGQSFLISEGGAQLLSETGNVLITG